VAKYRQHGYQDRDRESQRERPREEPRKAPPERTSGPPKWDHALGPRPLNLPGTRAVSRCAQCGTVLQGMPSGDKCGILARRGTPAPPSAAAASAIKECLTLVSEPGSVPGCGDADFLGACDQRHFMVDAGSGEEMDAITRETLGLSPEVRAKIGAMLNAM